MGNGVWEKFRLENRIYTPCRTLSVGCTACAKKVLRGSELVLTDVAEIRYKFKYYLRN